MYKVDVIDMVRVRNGVAAEIKRTVSEKNFYRVSDDEKITLLNELAQNLIEIYGRERSEKFGNLLVEHNEGLKYGMYFLEETKIEIGRISIITFLNCFRSHLTQEGGVSMDIDNEELDKMAWSARAFNQ